MVPIDEKSGLQKKRNLAKSVVFARKQRKTGSQLIVILVLDGSMENASAWTKGKQIKLNTIHFMNGHVENAPVLAFHVFIIHLMTL